MFPAKVTHYFTRANHPSRTLANGALRRGELGLRTGPAWCASIPDVIALRDGLIIPEWVRIERLGGLEGLLVRGLAR